MKSFKKHISFIEKATAIFIWVLLIATLAVRFIYGGELMLLIAFFAVCSAVFSFLLITPISYEFKENELFIANIKPLADIHIPYKSITRCDTIGSFALSKMDIDAVEVVITYNLKDGKRKKKICCHPKKVDRFIKTLQDSCPNMEYDPD